MRRMLRIVMRVRRRRGRLISLEDADNVVTEFMLKKEMIKLDENLGESRV